MKILDLFCGCGGFSLGFLQASPLFTVVLAIDNDFRAIHTYQANIDPDMTLTKNIREVHSLDILGTLKDKAPDIIIASPPCEPYSSANPNRKKTTYDQLYADETGRLILDVIRLIVDLEPAVFIIENVSQIGSTGMQQLIRHEFARSKFDTIHFNSLEAVNYGVPSFRRRVFISNIQFPFFTTQRVNTVRTALKSLQKPNTDFYNHETAYVPPSMRKKIPKTPPGGALIYFRGSQSGTFRNFVRLHYDQPSPTVMGKSRFIHPLDHRLCTVREHARLMSYPDVFRFFGPLNYQYNQVGESVPPLLSKFIAYQVLDYLKEN